jgi:CHAD domain-containing protein
VRALLPVVLLAERETEAVLCGASGEAVVVAVVHGVPTVSGAPAGLVPWTVDVVSLRGHRKAAKQLRDHLEELGFRWLPGDALDLAIVAAGVAPAGFNGSPTVPLDATSPAVEAYRAVLSNLAVSIAANWHGTVDDVDPEFLHDLRVAVRRTRTVLSEPKDVIPAPVRNHYRESFGWFGQITGPARDLDVIAMEWDDYVAPLSPATIDALEPVRAHLLAQRRDAHRVLAEELSSPKAAEIMSSWQAWLASPIVEPEPEPDSDGERSAALVVAHRIRRAQRRLLARGRSITADSPPEELHELRKDAKKLRYLLECFGGLLATRPRTAFVRRLKALQENLGEHQDSAVHVAVLHSMAHDLGAQGASVDTLVAIGGLAAHLDQRRLAARTEFATQFASYDSRESKRALRKMLAGLE